MAQYQLGLAYDNGLGTRKNLKSAIRWYTEAAARGFDRRNSTSGLSSPTSVEGNATCAKQFHCIAKQRRKATATLATTLAFTMTWGEVYQRIAGSSSDGICERRNSGTVESQRIVGYCYHEGEGVRRDFEQAVFWYRKARVGAMCSRSSIWDSATSMETECREDTRQPWYGSGKRQNKGTRVQASNCLSGP